MLKPCVIRHSLYRYSTGATWPCSTVSSILVCNQIAWTLQNIGKPHGVQHISEILRFVWCIGALRFSFSLQACVPDLLKEALTCLDQVNDADGTVRRLKTKVSLNFVSGSFSCVIKLQKTCVPLLSGYCAVAREFEQECTIRSSPALT